MKKILCILLALTMLATLAVGCSAPAEESQTTESQATESQTTEEAPAEEVTLKIANYAVLEAGYTDFWNNAKADFEAANPGITIEYVTAPYGEIAQNVIQMAGAGDTVDAVFSEVGWIPMFEDVGLAAPVEDIMSAEFIADYDESIKEAHSLDGVFYGAPLYVSPYILYYNEDILEQAGVEVPTTYDELLVASEEISKLTDANGNKIWAFGTPTASVPVSGSAVNAMVFNYGGEVMTADGQLSLDNDGFRQTLELMKELDDKGYMPQNQKFKDLRNLFALGQLAMYYDASWGLNGVLSIEGTQAADYVASAKPLSGGEGTGTSALQSHCFVLIDNGDAQKAALAKFIEYIISEEVLADYMINLTPAYPATKSMADMELHPALEGASGSQNNCLVQVPVGQLANFNLDLCSLAQAVTMGDVDIDTAIEDFTQAATTTLSE